MKNLTKLKLYTASLAFFAVLGSSAAFAQEQQTSAESTLTPKFGFKGGLNFSNLYISDVKDENVKLGFNGGFFAKLPVTKGLSIQPELLYSSKGSKDTYNNAFQGSGEYRFNLNYIEAPILAVINITPNFSVSGGAYVAYLASANVKDVHSDGTINGVKNLNADDFHRFDSGLVGGASIDIENITIGARYNYGLQTVGKSGNVSGDVTKNSKNSVATLFIGFAF
jgi:hypothetical protein